MTFPGCFIPDGFEMTNSGGRAVNNFEFDVQNPRKW